MREISLDPLQFRLRNAAKEGTRRPDGPTSPIGYLETVQAALASDHYRAPLEGLTSAAVWPRIWFNVGLQSSVSINVNADGSVTLVEGSTDIGGARLDRHASRRGAGLEGRRSAPDRGGYRQRRLQRCHWGSRTTFASGYAAIEAAQDVVRQMIERAARIWKVEPPEVTFADGFFITPTPAINI